MGEVPLFSHAAMQTASLIGRRVEIHSLTSPQGQQLNGQVGGVTSELEAQRLCVRLERNLGEKSIHRSKLFVQPLTSKEMTHITLVPQRNDKQMMEKRIYQSNHLQKWPAETVAFHNAQQHKHYGQLQPEEAALQMHQDFHYKTLLQKPPRFSAFDLLRQVDNKTDLRSVLKFGLSLDVMLKVLLRRVAGIEPSSLHALWREGGYFADESRDLSWLVRTAQETGRDVELACGFDCIDLVRTILAAERVAFKQLPEVSNGFKTRSSFASPALRGLTALLFCGGVSVRGLAGQARTNFLDFYSDCRGGANQFAPNLNRCFRRLDQWCVWEEQQWRLTMDLFGERGRGLPLSAAALIASCIAEPPVAACQATPDDEAIRAPQVMQVIEPNELASHIEEEALRADSAPQFGLQEATTAVHEIRAQSMEPKVLTETVSFPVVHLDPPARISEQEASQIVSEQHAGFVERNLGCSFGSATSDAEDTEIQDAVFLSKLNRNPKELRRAFLEGLPLKECRATLEAEGYPVKHISGALCFVHPEQYRLTLHFLSSIELKPDHLVFAQSLEHLVQETMLPWAQGRGIQCKSREQLKLSNSSCAACAGDSELQDPSMNTLELIVERTFLCSAPVLVCGHTVNQSTTGAESRKGPNPRTKAPLWDI